MFEKGTIVKLKGTDKVYKVLYVTFVRVGGTDQPRIKIGPLPGSTLKEIIVFMEDIEKI